MHPEERESITSVSEFGHRLDFDHDTSPLTSTNVISPPQQPPPIHDPIERAGGKIARTPLETAKRRESSRKKSLA